MRQSHSSPVLFAALLATAAGCSDASSQNVPAQGASSNAAVAPPPGGSSAPGGNQSGTDAPHIGESHQGGQASNLFLLDLSFGRLVDVFEVDGASGERHLVYEDVVVGPDVASDGVDYELGANLAQRAELTILHDRATFAFAGALAAAEAARLPLSGTGQPPWSVVPRDAAVSIRVDDLLDPSTITPITARLFVGDPALVPYPARVLADANHGALADPDGDGVSSFYPTRIVLDLTVSELDGQSYDPPLPVNGLGLPPADSTSQPNVQLRLPTKLAPLVGQNVILANPAGNGLSFGGNGTNDPSTPTKDVLRDFRSGGATDVTGDPFNGMLPDSQPPRIVGELLLAFSGSIQPDPAIERGYVVSTAVFNTASCTSIVAPGDLIQQSGLTAVVVDTGLVSGPVVSDLRLRVLFSNTGRPTTGLAALTTAYDAGSDDADCFIGYVPTASTRPNQGVPPNMMATVRFSEPMDASTLSAFYGFTLADAATSPAQSSELIAGQIHATPSALEFDFLPSAALPHTQGTAETYHVHVGDDPALPVTNLAGLALAEEIDDALFHVDAAAPSNSSGNLVLRFESADMLGADGFEEFRGQFLLDLGQELMRPRPVSRFQAAADRSNPLPGAMTAFSSGVQAPLVPLGSKLHTLWRYADMGFSLLDEANMNLDVEGLSWAPAGGQVISDAYPEFSITLGHGDKLPDEVLDPQTFFPKYPASGLGTVFADNFLEPGEVVHPKRAGYVVNPADLYVSASGTPMMPYPLNQAGPVEDNAYYTWRDTSIQSLGGDLGAGVPLDQEIAILGLGPDKDYASGAVPSIGLPLLMEFRCYPTNQAIGVNAFDISLAANSSPRPNFRAYSSGGFDTSGNPVLVDPDLATVATGGFNPGSNPPGASTPPTDNSYYIGAVDFVTTKSRAHSIWIDTRSVAPNFEPAVLLGELPAGTDIELAFRGADAIAGGAPSQPFYIAQDAAGLDPYGDPLPEPAAGAPVFFAGDGSWKSDISALNGARYVQVRVSFLGDPVSSQVANLGGLGLAWSD